MVWAKICASPPFKENNNNNKNHLKIINIDCNEPGLNKIDEFQHELAESIMNKLLHVVIVVANWLSSRSQSNHNGHE